MSVSRIYSWRTHDGELHRSERFAHEHELRCVLKRLAKEALGGNSRNSATESAAIEAIVEHFAAKAPELYGALDGLCVRNIDGTYSFRSFDQPVKEPQVRAG